MTGVPRARSMHARARRGASLAELLVALTVLAIGGSLAAGALHQATRDLEAVELGIRAMLILSEAGSRDPDSSPVSRPAGPGRLHLRLDPDGAMEVRYEPPGAESDGFSIDGNRRGFFAPMRWVVEIGG